MEQQSFIRDFLLSPRFRIWRYLSLFLFFIIISVNQSIVGYREILPVLGNKVYIITVLTILTYMVVFYITLRVFVTKYLLSAKYIQFVISIFVTAAIFEIIPLSTFGLYIEDYDYFSRINIVDTISSYIIYLLCISGVIIPVFLRNWIISRQRVDQLEKKRMFSEVEQLKEQINPSSFFKTLNETSVLIKSDPNKASMMLMKLSQLLRYQLYDCNRETVLLRSEISFLQNYLELERLYSSKFNYKMTENNINTVFIAPSILLPYVQSVVNVIENQDEPPVLDIYISNEQTYISVDLKLTGIYDEFLLNNELTKVRERLETLYKDHYRLSVTTNESADNTAISLGLDKE